MKSIVPDEVKETVVVRVIAADLSRKEFRERLIESLSEGVNVDLEKALKEFEETRDEV